MGVKEKLLRGGAGERLKKQADAAKTAPPAGYLFRCAEGGPAAGRGQVLLGCACRRITR